MREPNANYYNGTSSTPFKAAIDFELENPVLTLNVEGLENPLHWLLAYIEVDYNGKDRLLLSYAVENEPRQILEIQDASVIDLLNSHLKKAKKIDSYDRILHLKKPVIYALAGALVLSLVLIYFFVLPWLVEAMVPTIPRSVDQSIGEKGFEQMVTSEDIDSARTAQLRSFVSQVDFGDSSLKIQPLVVKSDVLNAFALSDGHIVVYSAILDSLHTSEELVALLGHEFAHVEKRHTMKLLCRSLSGYLVVSLMLSHANGVMSTLLDNARTVEQLSYSRVFEQEADDYGFKVLVKNRINPNGMLQLFQMLEKESKINIPKFLSSHPLTQERINEVKLKISKSIIPANTASNLDSIFRLVKHPQ